MLGDIHRAHKNPGFHIFFGILGVSLEMPSISSSRCEKPSISEFLFETPSISIKIQGSK